MGYLAGLGPVDEEVGAAWFGVGLVGGGLRGGLEADGGGWEKEEGEEKGDERMS